MADDVLARARMYRKNDGIDWGLQRKFLNCAWCGRVKNRLTGEPLAESIQGVIRKKIQSHGICPPCAEGMRKRAEARGLVHERKEK